MITVLQRPEGHVLQPTSQSAAATEDYGTGDALFTDSGHGLVDGDYLYAISDIEDYNGFWYVDQISSSTFKLKSYADAEYVQWIQNGTITWYKSQDAHGWSAVHLPIVYKLRSDLFPTNESDTARTVLSFSESYGYTNLVLSGSLGTFEELRFIKITGTNDLDGVYQILDKVSSSSVTINLAYGSHDFTGGEVILYYSSYAIIVKVYVDDVLAATIPYVPDDSNEITFSINEIVKGYINHRNNLLLGNLPKNTDFSKEFRIEYAETYDQTDGYTITTFESGFTEDGFTGYAVNSDLPFKNRYSGFMSEYLFAGGNIYEDDVLGKFLTNFLSPLVWAGFFFDLSFIKPREGEIIVTVNGAAQQYTDQGIGLYRIPIMITEGELCVSVTLLAFTTSNPNPDPTFATLAEFENSGSGIAWSTGANPSVTLDNGETAQLLRGAITTPYPDIIYTVEYDLDVASLVGLDFFILRVRLYDSTMSSFVQIGISESFSANGNFTGSRQGAPTFIPAYVVFYVEKSGIGSDDATLDINSYSASATAPSEDSSYPEAQIIEELCLEVSDECYEDSIYLTWLNNLGGFDYWLFTAEKDYLKEIVTSQEKTKNILPDWPKSFGETADTIRSETSRQTREQQVIRSQYVTLERLQAILKIKESSLVQIVNSRRDRRTVLVDVDSFTQWKDDDSLYQIQFTITYTNDNPSQKA